MTPEGAYTIEADWVVGCDGASSPLRAMMALDFDGRAFEDSFLIADIRMKNESFPDRALVLVRTLFQIRRLDAVAQATR